MTPARTLVFAPVAVAFAAGAVAARVATAFAPERIAPDRAQPVVVVTAWGGYGAACFAIFATTVVLAAVAWRSVLRRSQRDERPPGIRTLLAATALALAACFAWPFTFSSDPYAYAAYGDLAARGFDPYAAVPPAAHDALLDDARFQWSGPFPPCVYGPAFVALARGVVEISRDPVATLWFFRLAAAFAFLTGIACAYAALDPLPGRRRFAVVATFALHPVVLWSVAEGHNDALICGIAGICTLLARRSAALAAFAVASAAALKATALAFAGAFALEALAVRLPAATRVAAGAVAGTALGAVVTVPPLLEALRFVKAHGVYAPSISLQGLAGPAVAVLAASAAAAAGAVALWRGNLAGLAWFGLAAFAALPNPYPWYALWLVPLAAVASGAAPRALLGVTICAALRYLPDAYGNMPGGWTAAASVVALLPALPAIIGIRRDLTPPTKAPAHT